MKTYILVLINKGQSMMDQDAHLVDQSFRALSVEQARRFASVRADKAGMEVCVLA